MFPEEDTTMASIGSVSDNTSMESIHRNVMAHLQEQSNAPLGNRNEPDALEKDQPSKNTSICRKEDSFVNQTLSSPDTMSHTSRFQLPAVGDTSLFSGEDAVLKTAESISTLNCSGSVHGPEKSGAHFVTIEAGEQAVQSSHSDFQQTKVRSPKRKAKRRRNGHSKHSRKVSGKRADEEQTELPVNTPEYHRHEYLSVGLFKEAFLSNSDIEEEDGPSEKKERFSEPGSPANEKTSELSVQPADQLSASKKPTSQKLKKRYPKSSKPPHTQPVQVMFPPQESMLRRDRAMSLVLDSFQLVGKALEASGEDGLFILNGINYDHYLCRLPAPLLRCRDGGYLGDSPNCRGILDIMILQRHAGMVLVQVKSVGGNLGDWQADEKDMVQAVKTVVDRVRARSPILKRNMYRELIAADSSPDRESTDAGGDSEARGRRGGGGRGGGRDGGGEGREGRYEGGRRGGGAGGGGGGRGGGEWNFQDAAADAVQHILVVPFIPRKVYEKAVQDSGQSNDSSGCPTESKMHVLCKEDFDDASGATHHDLVDTGRSTESSSLFSGPLDSRYVGPATADRCNHLLKWWRRTFDHSKPDKLSRDKIKEIVGRICGPFSTRAAQPDSKCRSEVRTYGHCISETAQRYSAPCLTLSQFGLLICRDPYVALCAPPGSGKSLLLSLKAVQWLEQGAGDGQDHVVVASFSRHKMASTPPPCDQLLLSAIFERKMDTLNHRKTGELLHATFPSMSDVVPDDVELEVSHTIQSLLKCVHQARSSDSRKLSDDHVDDREINDSDFESSLLNNRFHFVINDVDSSNDENTLLVLGTLCRHPRVESVWWSTSEPLKTREMMSHFRVETLELVTRRPPSVQRVMKALEWREPWRELYAVDSVGSSLPTEGPPIVFIQHRLHAQNLWTDFRDPPTCRPSHCDPVRKNSDQGPSQVPVQTVMNDDDTWNCLEQTDQEDVMHQDQSHDHEQFSSNARERNSTNHEHEDGVPTAKSHDLRFCTAKQDASELLLLPNEEPECLHLHTGNSRSVRKKGETYPRNHFHSPFWCERCADSAADMISQIVIDSISPNVAPFLVGSTKLLKEPSKNRFGEAIKPRDILILADFTPQNSGMPDDRLKALVHSSLVLRIQEVVPLKIITEECSSKIVFPSNSAVLTDIATARGVERKVVIYVPGNTGKAPTCVASQQRIATTTSLVQSLDGYLQCRTKETSVSPNLTRNNHALNGHPETDGRISSVEHASLSSPCAEASPRCLQCDEAIGGRTSGQRFVRCEEDTNRNSLILAENREEHVSRLVSNDDPHEYGDIVLWSRDSSETSDRKNDAVKERETEEDRTNLFSKASSYHNEERSKGNPYSKQSSPPTSFTSTLQNQEQHPQQEQETGVSVSSTPIRTEQLPRWIADKERLIRQRNDRYNIGQNPQSSVQCRSIRQAPSSPRKEASDVTTQSYMHSDLQRLLAGLSEVSRRGVFAAAACCLAQLVIVLP